MKLLLDPRRNWRSSRTGDTQIHAAGDHEPVAAVAQAMLTGGLDAARDALESAVGHFAAVLQGPFGTLAFVDHCRSIPLFHDGASAVSNDARLLLGYMPTPAVDLVSVLEAAMAGYVSGPFTLYHGLHQLQSGELLRAHEKGGRPLCQRYFLYQPRALRPESAAELAAELGGIVDRVMTRVIEAAAGAPVWVPLSGGLDSRLVLCKLAELGCPNLRSFSYGPAGNDEAGAASEVARCLGVPWRFVPSRRRATKQFFKSADRRAYWEFADGLCSVPNPQDIVALRELMADGTVHPGDVVVNGQTGDFISGGHIPARLVDHDEGIGGLLAAVVDKHYSLWGELKTPENLAAIHRRILADLDLNGGEDLSRQQAAALYERWEYQERQAKFIVNGERIYDFLGLSWRLPLWDQEFVRFWRDIPAPVKAGKAVYRTYLSSYDYRGLFKSFAPAVWHWPGSLKAILPLARVVRLARGEAARDRFLKAFLYFGMYRHHYAPYRYRDFLNNLDNVRNPISFLTATWLREDGLKQPGLPAL